MVGIELVAGCFVLDQFARVAGHAVGHVPEVVDFDVGDEYPSGVCAECVEDCLAVVLDGVGEGVQRLDSLFQSQVQPGGLVHMQAVGGCRHFVGRCGLEQVVTLAGTRVSYFYGGERGGGGHGWVSCGGEEAGILPRPLGFARVSE